jgi:hypothetical protein
MPMIGFSTGAVARGDFARALYLLDATSMTAIELSALRLAELPILIAALPSLDLHRFKYVSVHAPSHFSADEEQDVIELLRQVRPEWPIILHPDTIHDVAKWRPLGAQIAIENMDRRKEAGRSAEELGYWFELLPSAQLCLDLAHAHQVDRTMTEAYRILKRFRGRICQLHISELDSTGHHFPLSLGSIRAFREVASMVPTDSVVIIESLNPLEDAAPLAQITWVELEAQRACLALGWREFADSQAVLLGTRFYSIPAAG